MVLEEVAKSALAEKYVSEIAHFRRAPIPARRQSIGSRANVAHKAFIHKTEHGGHVQPALHSLGAPKH